MITQKFTIKPSGMIKDGSASFVIDPKTGAIKAHGEIKANLLFKVEPYGDDEAFTVDPQLLRSQNLKKGQRLQFGAVTLIADDVKEQTAHVSVVIESGMIKANGFAVVDLRSEFLVIKGATLKGSYSVFPLTLELVPA